MKSLRQQLRKSHDQVLAGQRKAGELGDEVRRLSEANHKLEEVVGRTRLLERDRLTDQLQHVAGKLAEKEKRVAVRTHLQSAARIICGSVGIIFYQEVSF